MVPALAELERDGTTSFLTDDTARRARSIAETLRVREAEGDKVWSDETTRARSRCLHRRPLARRPGGSGDPPGPLATFLTAHFKAMLDEIGFETYVYRPFPKMNSKGREQTSHRFGVVKPDPDAFHHDGLHL